MSVNNPGPGAQDKGPQQGSVRVYDQPAKKGMPPVALMAAIAVLALLALVLWRSFGASDRSSDAPVAQDTAGSAASMNRGPSEPVGAHSGTTGGTTPTGPGGGLTSPPGPGGR